MYSTNNAHTHTHTYTWIFNVLYYFQRLLASHKINLIDKLSLMPSAFFFFHFCTRLNFYR